MHKTLALVAAAALLAAGCVSAPRGTKLRVVGASERVHVGEAKLDFLALIDTGAHRSSIHAFDLRILEPARRMHDNVGKRIRFRVRNERGDTQPITTRITDVEAVRSSHGTEWRYVVSLHLRLRDVEKRVRVSLRDRSMMSHKLLIGRDWLRGDFVVDVGRNPVD